MIFHVFSILFQFIFWDYIPGFFRCFRKASASQPCLPVSSHDRNILITPAGSSVHPISASLACHYIFVGGDLSPPVPIRHFSVNPAFLWLPSLLLTSVFLVFLIKFKWFRLPLFSVPRTELPEAAPTRTLTLVESPHRFLLNTHLPIPFSHVKLFLKIVK